MDTIDDESDWRRQVLVGVAVLLVVGALIGGIVAVISIKAADLAGINDTKAGSPSNNALPAVPDPDPSQSSTTPAPSTTSSSAPPSDTGMVLKVSPKAVSTYQRINLTGTYTAPAGSTLQVQRKDGNSWVDFPVTAHVNGGKFATYVETGRAGPNLFRMLDVARGDTSNTVTVQVS